MFNTSLCKSCLQVYAHGLSMSILHWKAASLGCHWLHASLRCFLYTGTSTDRTASCFAQAIPRLILIQFEDQQSGTCRLEGVTKGLHRSLG